MKPATSLVEVVVKLIPTVRLPVLVKRATVVEVGIPPDQLVAVSQAVEDVETQVFVVCACASGAARNASAARNNRSIRKSEDLVFMGFCGAGVLWWGWSTCGKKKLADCGHGSADEKSRLHAEAADFLAGCRAKHDGRNNDDPCKPGRTLYREYFVTARRSFRNLSCNGERGNEGLRLTANHGGVKRAQAGATACP